MIVHDDSMRPTFLPGDRLYVDPRPDRPLTVGDVVALRDPERPGRLLLKRVVRLEPCEPGATGPPPVAFVVEGDNAAQSRDSRHFGPVLADALVGLVWFRYAPASRAGPVASRTF